MALMQSPVNKCPYRSPMAVSETIKHLIQGKKVCELGCAEGDNLFFMARYAKEVIGFEYLERRYKVAQQRGLNVVVGDYYKDPIPDADVYYFWPDDGEKDNEYLVQKLLNKPGFDGIIIVGGDTGFPPEIPSVKRCSQWGTLLQISYNEGTGHREHGVFNLAVIDVKQLKQQCTFILSAPRSGSSCTTGSLSLCGLSLGKTVTTVKDQFNQKGYFENQEILTFNESVLKAVGSSIFATAPLTDVQVRESLQFTEKLKELIKSEFTDKFFMIKDPRINILQALYKTSLQQLNINYNVVVLHRKSEHACKSMNRMTGISEERALSVFENHYSLIDKFTLDTLAFSLSFEDLLTDPHNILKQACYLLKIPYGYGRHRITEINQFIERSLLTFN